LYLKKGLFFLKRFSGIPKAVEIAVIKKSAASAPLKTAILLYLIAIIAAIKKVLSPSSETTMEEKD